MNLLSRSIFSDKQLRGVDALFVTNPYNIRYASGFSGMSTEEREAFFILGKRKSFLILPRLYQEEGRRLAKKGMQVVIATERNRLFDLIGHIFEKEGFTSVAIEAEHLFLHEYRRLKKQMKKIKFHEVSRVIEAHRKIKNKQEISFINKAQHINEVAFRKLLKLIRVGMSEHEVAERLVKLLKSFGGQGLAFDPIIAFGKNAAFPHHHTGDTRIKKGSMLLIDFGAKYRGYCSDMTKTIFIGKPTTKFLERYHLVLGSHNKGLEHALAGKREEEVFDAAEKIFRKEKLAQYFTHGLGHGTGLQVHEEPYIRSGSKEKIENGMVFSIEPGLYFPGWGGIRIENLVNVQNGSAKILGDSKNGLVVV